ncbi:MAG: glycine dehydrogenase (aminomethyl-transferring), partial [Rubripirellula sp.]|nr:glycine dehydrogenase (aminomethyl-transferring) [Rubripirellula sp.]
MSNDLMTQMASDLATQHRTDLKRKASGGSVLDFADAFAGRHIGPSNADIESMLSSLGFADLEELTDATIPQDIQLDHELDIPNPRGEHEFLNGLATIASKNKVYRSCIGMGYTGTVTPPVILRNVLENPGWYTQYT